MRKTVLWTTAILLGWLGLDMIGLKIGPYYLVEKEWGASEGTLFVLLLGSLLLFMAAERMGKYILGSVLILWGSFQFAAHWRYVFFGAEQELVESYNKLFANNLRLFPMSGTAIIPDLYHFVLMALTVATLVVWVVYMFKKKSEPVVVAKAGN